jgi:phage terminase small subunit
MSKKKTPPKGRSQKTRKPAKLRTNTQLREERFAYEYVIDLRGKDAAIRAGYPAASARIRASELLSTPRVREKVDKLMAEKAKRNELTADKVLQRVVAIASADPRELIELRRVCCRYCYGKGHRYQRTPREMEEFRKEFDQTAQAKAAKLGMPVEELLDEFDDQGGIGWDPRKEPSQDCPECFGDGDEKTFCKDQRDVSPSALALLAGTKVTEKGIEVKMHNQTDMLIKAGQHVGLFKQPGTDPNNPVHHEHHLLTDLVDMVKGSETGIGPARRAKPA